MLSYQKQGIFSPNRATSLSGFGFGHDGTGQALPLPHFYFLSTMDVPQLIDTRAFVLASDSITDGTAPVVGHVLTVDNSNASSAAVAETLAVMESRADPALQDINQYWNDVVATGCVGGEYRKLRYDGGTGRWLFDHTGALPLTTAELLGLVGEGDLLNFIGVPVGYGARLGGDRNQDGVLDGDAAVPDLFASVEGDAIRLEWNDRSTGWFLQSSPDLREPWSVLGRERSGSDAGWIVLDPRGARSRNYYRLQRTWW